MREVASLTVATLLILNDRFGALTTALAESEPVLWSDSFLARKAAEYNLQQNRRGGLRFVGGDRRPSGRYRLVIARVPKSLVFWHHQLLTLRTLLEPGAQVLASGLTKHLPRRAQELMEACLGPTHRRLAVKKARILDGRFDPELAPLLLESARYRYNGLELENFANLFSRSRLDEGTEVLLASLTGAAGSRVLDLACGNGILGLAIQRVLPQARLTFLDESYQAVSCAELNYRRHFQQSADFLVADGLEDYQGPAFDLLVCNPPFHQEHEVGDGPGWRLLRGAYHHLAVGGELRWVANRHLGYHVKIRRLFRNCEVLTSHPKFVAFRAQKSDPR